MGLVIGLFFAAYALPPAILAIATADVGDSPGGAIFITLTPLIASLGVVYLFWRAIRA